MRKILTVLMSLAALAGIGLADTANAQQRVFDRECRKAVVKMCGMDREKAKACIRERHSELPDKCQEQLKKAVKERLGERSGKTGGMGARGASQGQTLKYGNDPKQGVDYYAASGGQPGPPLIVFVHGGGWQIGDRSRVQLKPGYFNDLGYAFASAGYRLVPDARVEDQLADLASAIAMLRGKADDLGFDGEHIVLIGHSAGAHLAAMLGSDPAWLGQDFAGVDGVILLDGAGYDVARQMQSARGALSGMYQDAFGSDPERQARLSPASHGTSPNIASWLILHVAQRPDSTAQSSLLANALRAGGATVQVEALSGTDHGRLNRELGAADKPQTALVSAYLAGLFAS